MRWIRLLTRLLISTFQTRLSIDQTSTLSFRVWMTDIDVSFMNHAAMMTVFETGRIDFMVRTGFFKLARQQKWYVPMSSINVQFFRPLKIFQKAVLTTRVFHMTDHFIFLEQKITKNEKNIAICMVKSKVKSSGENISTQQIVRLLNGSMVPLESTEIIDLFKIGEDAFKSRHTPE